MQYTLNTWEYIEYGELEHVRGLVIAGKSVPDSTWVIFSWRSGLLARLVWGEHDIHATRQLLQPGGELSMAAHDSIRVLDIEVQ